MARLIADPCGATLVPGLFGATEGMIARLKSVLSCDFGTCGYVLWCPRYHNAGWQVIDQHPPPFTAGHKFRANLFGWAIDNPDARPVQGGGVWQGFGIGNNFTDGLNYQVSTSFPDPAWKLISDENAIVLDARTLSACIRMAYFGAMFSSAGQVGFIQDIPLSVVMGNGDGDLESKEPCASVNDLFKLATRTQRLGTDTLEVVMRHSPGSELFQSSEDPAITTNVEARHPDPQYLSDGLHGSQPRLGDNADNFAATVFGFVWKNVTAPAALSFELVKNVEWRPSLDSGFQAVKPESVRATSYVQEAQSYLDKAVPDWRAHTADVANSAASALSKMAFTGVAGMAAAALGRANRGRLGFAHGREL